ncbi:MAG: hypothetical protein JXJ19_08440 [Elusimicrobia bacterium]|nr:hypothetical protein [Elusimicrobiota bacterium]
MEGFNRFFSLFALFLGSVLWVSSFASRSILLRAEERIISSVSLIVYLDEQVSGSDIQQVRKEIEESKGVFIKRFLDSKSVYEDIKKDLSVSDKVDMIKEDFIFPASFELGIDDFNIDAVKNIAENLDKSEIVQSVEYPEQLIRRSDKFLKAMRRTIYAALACSVISVIILFSISAYLYILLYADRLRLADHMGMSREYLFFGGLRSRAVAGICTSLAASLTVAFAAMPLGYSMPAGKVFTDMLFIAVLAAASYLAVFRSVKP